MGVVPGLKPSLPRVGGGVGHVCWRWEEWSREEGGQLTGLLSIVSHNVSYFQISQQNLNRKQ